MQSVNELQIGGMIPNDGTEVHARLSELVHAGKTGVIVVFWSGVCSHCTRYDDFLNSFEGNYPNVSLIVIACREGEALHEVEATRAARGLRFPIFFDEDREIAHAWQVQQTPRVFLVDSGLRLRYRGAIDNYKYPDDPGYKPYLESALHAFRTGQTIKQNETPGFGCAIESVYYSLAKPYHGR